MKKNITDRKLENMLENIYNSEVRDSFEFHSSTAFSDSENIEMRASTLSAGGAERIKHMKFPRYAAVAAIALAVAASGIYGTARSGIERNSPAAQLSAAAETTTPAPAETTSLFEEYLAEFEYETQNFEYECIKVTPDTKSLDNDRYTDLCYTSNIIPAYEGCEFIPQNDGSVELKSDSEFYLYIKMTASAEDIDCNVYSRQAYLVWKDQNDNITAIRPSREKTDVSYQTSGSKRNQTVFTADEKIMSLMDNFHSADEVYIDGVLVRPALSEYEEKFHKAFCQYSYMMDIEIDGNIIPVSVGAVRYVTSAGIAFENAAEISGIPLMNVYLNDGFVHYNKAFFYDCSGDEPIDISAKIAGMNENYWLETAFSSAENLSTAISETAPDTSEQSDTLVSETTSENYETLISETIPDTAETYETLISETIPDTAQSYETAPEETTEIVSDFLTESADFAEETAESETE